MITLGLVATALVYLRGWLGLRSTSPDAIPAWRAGAFLLGLVPIGIALAPPLASCDAGSLTGHMVQHLLLMTFAPPFLFLGEPVRALQHGLPSRVSAVLARSSRWPPAQRTSRMLAEP